MPLTKAQLYLTLPLLLALACGCQNGNPNAPATLSGKVTYKGDPIGGGTITFLPTEPGPAYTRSLNPDGTYTSTDMGVGEYSVVIETESVNPDAKGPTYGGGGQAAAHGGQAQPTGSTPPGQSAGPPQGGKYVKIPAKYGDRKTSGITVNVTAGKQTKDFALTD